MNLFLLCYGPGLGCSLSHHAMPMWLHSFHRHVHNWTYSLLLSAYFPCHKMYLFSILFRAKMPALYFGLLQNPSYVQALFYLTPSLSLSQALQKCNSHDNFLTGLCQCLAESFYPALFHSDI